ncbi:MAG: hypothetical protein AAB563_02610 [Patescibacteria group bacterium]
MGPENGPSDEDINFQAPRNDGQEPNNTPPNTDNPEPNPEEGEALTENLTESPEMIELRHRALNQLEDLRQLIDTLGPGGSVVRTTFETDYLGQYLELGRIVIEKVVPENRELANLQLEAWLGRFQQECGFQSNGIARQEIISNQLKKEGRQDLANKLLDFWIDSKQTWVKSVRVESKIPQEQIDQFLRGVTIEPLDEEAPEQSVNCQLTVPVTLDEFKLLVQQAILPKLNGNGTVFVRGDELPPEYLQELGNQMLRTDFPVIAIYDKVSGEYKVIYDEGAEEEHNSEPN